MRHLEIIILNGISNVGVISVGLNMRYLELKRKVQNVRMLAIQGIAEAGSGHPGASFSAAEIMGVLYFHKMNHRPNKPDWEERDFFINSFFSHVCMEKGNGGNIVWE